MKPYLSVIIPAYNEAQRLPETLAIVRDFLESKPYHSEVLVVDDGSHDQTVPLVKKNQARFKQLRLIANEVNQGKGAVVKQGMLEAKGEYRLFTDADNSTPISEVDKLLAYVPEYEVVIGSRYLQSDSLKIKQPWKRRFISRTSNLLIQSVLLPGIKDTQCGFKLFSAKAAERIFSKQSMVGWSFDIEILTIARVLRYQIKEVPVDWFDAKHSTFHAAQDASRFFQEFQQIRRNVSQHLYEEA